MVPIQLSSRLGFINPGLTLLVNCSELTYHVPSRIRAVDGSSGSMFPLYPHYIHLYRRMRNICCKCL